MTTDEIIELAIQGHASTRDAIRWAIQREREAGLAALNDLTLDHKSSDYYNGWLDMREAGVDAIRARNK